MLLLQLVSALQYCSGYLFHLSVLRKLHVVQHVLLQLQHVPAMQYGSRELFNLPVLRQLHVL